MRAASPAYLPGWYILRVERETEAGDAWTALAGAGVDGALSEWNADVAVMTIPRTERVAVADLDTVLPPGDPRRDPYIAGVSDLFRSGSSHLVYLPADRRFSEYRALVDSLPELSGSDLLDEPPGPSFQAVLVFAASVLAFAAVMKGRRFAVLASSIPIAALLLASGVRDPFPFIAAVYALAFLGGGRRRVAASAAALAAALFLLSASLETKSLLPALIALASSAAAYRIVRGRPGAGLNEAAAEKRRGFEGRAPRKPLVRKRTDHVLFEPVSLVAGPPVQKTRIPFGSAAAASAAAAAVFCLAFAWIFPFGTGEEIHDPVPVAAESYGPVSDWSAMAELDGGRSHRSLPDTASLIASAAFQEGFLYGAEYRLPLPGDRLVVTEYRDNGGRIVTEERTVVSYDHNWFRDILETETSKGVGALFAGLDGAAALQTATTRPTRRLVGANGTLLPVVRGLLAAMVSVLLVAPKRIVVRGTKERVPMQNSRRRPQAA